MPTQIEQRLALASAIQRIADQVTRGEFGSDGSGENAQGQTVDEAVEAAILSVLEPGA